MPIYAAQCGLDILRDIPRIGRADGVGSVHVVHCSRAESCKVIFGKHGPARCEHVFEPNAGRPASPIVGRGFGQKCMGHRAINGQLVTRPRRAALGVEQERRLHSISNPGGRRRQPLVVVKIGEGPSARRDKDIGYVTSFQICPIGKALKTEDPAAHLIVAADLATTDET
jgi:hypothetical protein